MDAVGQGETETRNMHISTSMHWHAHTCVHTHTHKHTEGDRGNDNEYASRMERGESSGNLRTEFFFQMTSVSTPEVFMFLDKNH